MHMKITGTTPFLLLSRKSDPIPGQTDSARRERREQNCAMTKKDNGIDAALSLRITDEVLHEETSIDFNTPITTRLLPTLTHSLHYLVLPAVVDNDN
jgi:hypothetical protein